jgi:hypothetical protein
MKLVNMLKFTMKILIICIFCIGFDGKYLPIGFDVLFIKDIKNMARFRRYFTNCSTLLNDINLRVSLVMIVKSCYSKIVASIMACSRSQHLAWMRFDSSGDC